MNCSWLLNCCCCASLCQGTDRIHDPCCPLCQSCDLLGVSMGKYGSCRWEAVCLPQTKLQQFPDLFPLALKVGQPNCLEGCFPSLDRSELPHCRIVHKENGLSLAPLLVEVMSDKHNCIGLYLANDLFASSFLPAWNRTARRLKSIFL